MLKNYEWKGLQWQFEEGEQPEGAVEVKANTEIKNKAVQPKNKAKKAEKK